MQNPIMLSYQTTLSQDLTERSQPRLDWISIEEIDALLRERSMLSQTNFSKSLLPNLMSSSDRFAKCDGIAPRGGAFYDLNAHRSDDHIKSEECVDLERLLYDNSDEPVNAQTAALAAIADDIGLSNNFATEQQQHRSKGVANTDTTYPFIYNKSNNNNNINSSLSDCDSRLGGDTNIKNNSINNNNCDNSNDCHVNTIKYNSPSGFHQSSTTTTTPSASQSPTNVLSMAASPNNSEYYVLNDVDITSENAIDGPSFFESLFYETLIPDNNNLFCTPDNSNGPIVFNETKANNVGASANKEHPLLTLTLKNSFVADDEINTPNIIDSIMEASENPLFTRREKIFKEEPAFITDLQDFAQCPSTSSPPAVPESVDTFSPAAAKPRIVPETRRKPGRPRKRRHTSDDERGEDDQNDETYVPPTHLRRKYREARAIPKKQIIYEDISDDDEQEIEYKPARRKFSFGSPSSSAHHTDDDNRLNPVIAFDEDSVRIGGGGKRGRPPKHARSISSDDYSLLDPEEAKYREMRDRNNEASRKSRYKRKQKEMLMTDELDDLEMDNIKLKAQVDELQKTVDRYRDNLMQVMLHKS